MGKKTLTKRDSLFFVIFLLILSQFINFGLASSANINSNENQSLSISPIEPKEPSLARIAVHNCLDIAIIDESVIVLTTENFFFLDTTNPKEPTEIPINIDDKNIDSKFTTYNKTLLIGRDNYGINYSILKFDLDNIASNCSDLVQFTGRAQKMKLTKDTFYSLNIFDHNTFEFLIYNATNINDLSLLGNSSIRSFDMEIYDSADLVVHENFVYLINDESNLLIYQINSTYQLEFIRKYPFQELRDVYFHGNYLFICDDQRLKVFDYTNPGNLIYISYYNIPNTRSIRITNNVACLVSDKAFTTLDLSNIDSISILDQYTLANREVCVLKMFELNGNLAIVLTNHYYTNDMTNGYSGYLYIFDVTKPDDIDRLYPKRIPLLSPFALKFVYWVGLFVGAPIVIVSIFLLINKIVKKRRQQKKEIDSID